MGTAPFRKQIPEVSKSNGLFTPLSSPKKRKKRIKLNGMAFAQSKENRRSGANQ